LRNTFHSGESVATAKLAAEDSAEELVQIEGVAGSERTRRDFQHLVLRLGQLLSSLVGRLCKAPFPVSLALMKFCQALRISTLRLAAAVLHLAAFWSSNATEGRSRLKAMIVPLFLAVEPVPRVKPVCF
jgi:hypothetical protein